MDIEEECPDCEERGKWCCLCHDALSFTWPPSFGGEGLCRECHLEDLKP